MGFWDGPETCSTGLWVQCRKVLFLLWSSISIEVLFAEGSCTEFVFSLEPEIRIFIRYASIRFYLVEGEFVIALVVYGSVWVMFVFDTIRELFTRLLLSNLVTWQNAYITCRTLLIFVKLFTLIKYGYCILIVTLNKISCNLSKKNFNNNFPRPTSGKGNNNVTILLI